jgi:hypothetical protein
MRQMSVESIRWRVLVGSGVGASRPSDLYTAFMTSTGISHRFHMRRGVHLRLGSTAQGRGDVVDPTGAPMEYLYIAGTVLAMAGGTFSFAALQWPRLFAIARRYDRSDLRKCAERRDLACRNRALEFVDYH